MKELEHLKSLWNEEPKIDKKTGKVKYGTRKSSRKLIVPGKITLNGGNDLTNGKWKYKVIEAFKGALGITLGTEFKEWKQTPFLSFDIGDSFDSQCGKYSIQIEDAKPLVWDSVNNKINQGFVRYKSYEIKDGRYSIIDIHTCNQMNFLRELITGAETTRSFKSEEPEEVNYG